MTIENGQGLGEPALSPDAAKTLLEYSGRAECNAEGGMNIDVSKLDCVGRGAVQIHLGGQPATLSAAIEQATGKPPVLSPEVLGNMARMALARHAALNPPIVEAVA